ncbi:MAG: CDP-diacylglycerol--serine O-phosphatidyltransferase [Endomicrobium sp.]|jgi:CDP-diacylglycerol--serine O-phosphatidyltransferase|nr:CDP-diacylglycerol--serine O-phosphatidyltransferase [Endomicrobium sp.]
MGEKLKKGIYIIPSLFTCGNLACGCLSLMSSINGDFQQAAWLLILAIFFDAMDGRIARLMKTTSKFGIQLDSLSDLISFGIAPSIMMYQLVLNSMGKLGMLIAVLFVLCSALRLSKFNVKVQDGVVHSFFSGLPTPASAGLLLSFVLSYELFIADSGQSLTFKTIPIVMKNMPTFFRVMPIVMVMLSLLMVSSIPYISFKKVNLSKPKTFRLLVSMILFALLVVAFPQNTIFILFSLYVLSGIVGVGAKYCKAYRKKICSKKGENNND